MNSRIVIQIMGHLRVLEVPSLLVIISLLLRVIGNQFLFTGVMVYALVRLFINIRFKISQDKFQEAILSHIDDIVETMDEEDNK